MALLPCVVDQIRTLRDKACWHDQVRPSAVDGVFESDTLVPNELKQQLTRQLDDLRDRVPVDQWDYHPGTDNQVLDLIHPSLYCYVRGVSSLLFPPGTSTTMGATGLVPAAADSDGVLQVALSVEAGVIRDTPVPLTPVTSLDQASPREASASHARQ
jgi:hypothetical protein